MKRTQRKDALLILLTELSKGEKSIEQLCPLVFQRVNCDTKGRCYEMLTHFLANDFVTLGVKNKTLIWKLNIKG